METHYSHKRALWTLDYFRYMGFYQRCDRNFFFLHFNKLEMTALSDSHIRTTGHWPLTTHK